MKKLSSIILASVISLSAVIPCIPSAAAEDALSSGSVDGPRDLLKEYPDGYCVDGNSVYFLKTVFQTSTFIVNSARPFSLKNISDESKDFGFVFEPSEGSVNLVSVCENFEQIVSFDIDEERKNHFHFFYPVINSYLVTEKDGKTEVKLVDKADYGKLTDLEALRKEYAEQARESNEQYFACFSKRVYSIEDILQSDYYPFVNTQLDGVPYVRTVYNYDDVSQEIVIGTDYKSSVEAKGSIRKSRTVNSGSYASLQDRIFSDDIYHYHIYEPTENASDHLNFYTKDSLTGQKKKYYARMEKGSFTSGITETGMGLEPIEPVKFDVNCDSEINIADLIIMSRYLMGEYSLTENGIISADVNDDGVTDVFDLIQLRKKILSLSSYVEDYMYKKDTTVYVTAEGEEAALKNSSYVFRSAKGFDEFAEKNFRPAVGRELKKSYDDEFFKENVLLLHLGKQVYGGLSTDVEGVCIEKTADEEFLSPLTIKLESCEVNCVLPEAVEIHQVIYPAEKLGEREVEWVNSRFKDIDSKHFSVTAYPEQSINENSIIVRTNDELNDFINNTYDDKNQEKIKEQFEYIEKNKGIRIDEDFFKDHFILFRIICWHNVPSKYNAQLFDGNIVINEQDSPFYGDVIELCLDAYIFDKRYDKDDLSVSFVDHRIIDEKYDPQGDTALISDDKDYNSRKIRISQYSFGNESAVSVYLTYTVGMALNAGNKRVLDVPVEKGFKPFGAKEDIEKLKEIPCESENYSVEWGESSVTVSFRTAPGGEFIKQTFDYDSSLY